MTCKSDAERGDGSRHGDGDGGDNGGSSSRRKGDDGVIRGSGSYGVE